MAVVSSCARIGHIGPILAVDDAKGGCHAIIAGSRNRLVAGRGAAKPDGARAGHRAFFGQRQLPVSLVHVRHRPGLQTLGVVQQTGIQNYFMQLNNVTFIVRDIGC